MGFAGFAFATEKPITFEWEQAGTDLATMDKWTLYYSETAGGAYLKLVDIPYVSEEATYSHTEPITLVNAGEERTIYFVLTASDKSGNESGYSNEVNALIDFKAPGSPFSFKIVVVP